MNDLVAEILKIYPIFILENNFCSGWDKTIALFVVLLL